MRYALIIATAALGLGVATPRAHALGCFTGGIMGAIAGHMAHHGVLGALGGCVAGHEWHKHELHKQAYQSREEYIKHRQEQDPNYRDPWTR